MKIKLLLGLVLIITLIASCNEVTEQKAIEDTSFHLTQKAADLYQIVGEKHDTAMLLMRDIEKARSALRVAMKAEGMEKAQKDTILDLLLTLKKADDGMMNWMREFKNIDLNDDEYKAWSEEETLNYLREEETKIEKVHVDMITAIANGNAFLAQ